MPRTFRTIALKVSLVFFRDGRRTSTGCCSHSSGLFDSPAHLLRKCFASAPQTTIRCFGSAFRRGDAVCGLWGPCVFIGQRGMPQLKRRLHRVSSSGTSGAFSAFHGEKHMPPVFFSTTTIQWTVIWVWLKIKQEGLRRCWSMFPLTRVPFWHRVFEPQPYMDTPRLSAQPAGS